MGTSILGFLCILLFVFGYEFIRGTALRHVMKKYHHFGEI